MKKIVMSVTCLIISMIAIFAASGFGSTSLDLLGSIGANSLLDVTQNVGMAPGVLTSIPLDQGVVLSTEPGIGVHVGEWKMSSNTTSNLVLKVAYTPFEATINNVLESVDYIVSNGSSYINSGDEFIALVKGSGIYPQGLNSGPIYLKRTDSDIYPPSFSYVATITFSLETE